MSICKKTCGCGSHLNFGVKATTEFGAAIRLGFMDYVNSDGDVNSLDLTATWDKTFWDALIANPDVTKRLNLTPNADEINPSVEDDVTQTLQSGRIIAIRDGVATYEFSYYGVDATFYNAMTSKKCDEQGVVMIDGCGAIAGHECDSGKLNVIQIAKGSLQVQYIPATLSTAAFIRVRFNLDLSESPVFNIVNDGDYEYNINKITPIFDGEAAAAATINSVTQTVIALQPVSAYTQKHGLVLKGLDAVPGNWVMTKVSDGTIQVIATVTEAPDGTYTFDYVGAATEEYNFHYLDATVEVDFNVTLA